MEHYKTIIFIWRKKIILQFNKRISYTPKYDYTQQIYLCKNMQKLRNPSYNLEFIEYPMICVPCLPSSFMMTSSSGNIFRVTGRLLGESTCHRWIPLTKPVTRKFDDFFYLRLNKRLSKQSKRQWFETPSRSLWCHCKVRVAYCPLN